jgi:hypothetical protein
MTSLPLDGGYLLMQLLILQSIMVQVIWDLKIGFQVFSLRLV